MEETTQVLLSASDILKEFSGVPVLKKVNFQINRGASKFYNRSHLER